MLKRLSGVLAFVLAVTALAALPVSAAETEGLIAGAVEFAEAEGSICASALIGNLDGVAEQTAMMILAQFKNKTLVSAAVNRVTVEPGKEAVASVEAAAEDGTQVRCFLLGAEMQEPLAAMAEYTTAAPALSGMTVNGEPMAGFRPDTTAYTIPWDSKAEGAEVPVPVVKGITANNSWYAVTSYQVTSAEAIATVRAKNAAGAVSQAYTVTFTLRAQFAEEDYHVVAGATDPAGYVPDPGFPKNKRSTAKVTANVNTKEQNINGTIDGLKQENKQYEVPITDGYVYTNFHAKDASDPADTGARWLWNRGPDTLWVKELTTLGAELKGCDYFALHNATFETKELSTFVDTSKDYLFSFQLAKDATVAVLTADGGDSKLDVSHGYTKTANNQAVATVWQGADASSGVPRTFTYMYTKKYSAGDTVTIPYTEDLGRSRPPIVVLIPALPRFKPHVSGFTSLVNGMDYTAYRTYAGIESYNQKMDTYVRTDNKESFVKDRVLILVNELREMKLGALTGPNTQRVIQEMSPVMDLEGCTFLSFDSNLNNVSDTTPWAPPAAGDRTVVWDPEAGAEVTLERADVTDRTAVWQSFQVNVPCDVIIFTKNSAPVNVDAGFNQIDYGRTILNQFRNNAQDNMYGQGYIKSYTAADIAKGDNIVRLYDTAMGAQVLAVVRPK